MVDKKKLHQTKRVRIIRPFKFAPLRVLKVAHQSSVSVSQTHAEKKKELTTKEIRAEERKAEGTQLNQTVNENAYLQGKSESDATQLNNLKRDESNTDDSKSTEMLVDTPLAQFDKGANPYAFYLSQIPTMLCSLPAEAMAYSASAQAEHQQLEQSEDVTENNKRQPLSFSKDAQKLTKGKKSESVKHALKPKPPTQFGEPQHDCQQVRFGGEPSKVLNVHDVDISITPHQVAQLLEMNVGELYFWLSKPHEVLRALVNADITAVLPLLQQTNNIRSLTYAHVLQCYQLARNNDVFIEPWPIEKVMARLASSRFKEQISLRTLQVLATQAKAGEYALLQSTRLINSEIVFKPLNELKETSLLADFNADELTASHSNRLFYLPIKFNSTALNALMRDHKQRWQPLLNQTLIEGAIPILNNTQSF